MWSDELDKNIRDAANKSMHDFEESSWQKMVPLLDEHLPQEKKRRRFILFWFTGLIIGISTASILFIRQQSFRNNKPVAEQTTTSSIEKQQNQTDINKPTVNNQEQLKENSTTTNKQQNNTREKTVPYETLINTGDIETVVNKERSVTLKSESILKEKNIKPADKNKQAEAPIDQESKLVYQDSKSSTSKKKISQQDELKSISSNQQATATDVPVIDNSKRKEDQQDLLQNKAPEQAEDKPATANEEIISATKTTIEDSSASISEQPVKKETKTPQRGSRLSLNISFGPDLSAVGTKPGNWKMQYGIGIGYAISKRVTVRTGFYVARKVYSADSTSYETQYNTIYNYFHLQKINANCLVYEIPVTVSYNITRSNNHNLFISAGLSSYFMKEEDYDYYYKSQNGMQYHHSYYYKNNSNIFSVINFSAGYQYNLSSRISILAEPYIRIPMTGIGNGKVKLNSTGVLFTVGYKPFLKKQNNTTAGRIP